MTALLCHWKPHEELPDAAAALNLWSQGRSCGIAPKSIWAHLTNVLLVFPDHTTICAKTRKPQHTIANQTDWRDLHKTLDTLHPTVFRSESLKMRKGSGFNRIDEDTINLHLGVVQSQSGQTPAWKNHCGLSQKRQEVFSRLFEAMLTKLTNENPDMKAHSWKVRMIGRLVGDSHDSIDFELYQKFVEKDWKYVRKKNHRDSTLNTPQTQFLNTLKSVVLTQEQKLTELESVSQRSLVSQNRMTPHILAEGEVNPKNTNAHKNILVKRTLAQWNQI